MVANRFFILRRRKAVSSKNLGYGFLRNDITSRSSPTHLSHSLQSKQRTSDKFVSESGGVDSGAARRIDFNQSPGNRLIGRPRCYGAFDHENLLTLRVNAAT